MISENPSKGETLIAIPTSLFLKVQARYKELGFESMSDYVAFVFTELLRDDDCEQGVLSEREEEMVREHLRGLGYLE